MIDALIHGRLIACREEGQFLVGRILREGGEPVQFSARRGAIKRKLTSLAQGMPVSVAGGLFTSVRQDKDGRPFVLHEITVSAVLTAEPESLMGSTL